GALLAHFEPLIRNVSVTAGPHALCLIVSVAVMRPAVIVPVSVPVYVDGAFVSSDPDAVALKLPSALICPRYVRTMASGGWSGLNEITSPLPSGLPCTLIVAAYGE